MTVLVSSARSGIGMLPGFPPKRPKGPFDVQISELRAVVIDFETTGLYPNSGDEIIELAAVHVNGNSICVDTAFDSLVNPQRSVSPSAYKIHGIPDELLVKQQHLETVLPAFMAKLDDRIVVGQNVVFDISFLVKALEKYDFPQLEVPVLDTKWLSRLAFPRENQHGLDTIAARLEVCRPRARHRALGDATYTAEVLVGLLDRCQKRGFQSIGDLFEAHCSSEQGFYGNENTLEVLRQCCKDRVGVEIAYTGLRRASPKPKRRTRTRKVDVYYISPPYFLGLCHMRNAIRTFRIDRVQGIQSLEHHYGIPGDFHPRDHFMRWTR